ncbi:MAG: phosphotransferase [Woeseia sp.]
MAGAKIEPASSDASFRRYFRVQANGKTAIAMDAPPVQEDCRPFLRIADYLHRMGLNSPGIFQADLDLGFLLMSDLGSTSYLEVLQRTPGRAAPLYGDATEALLTLQEGGRRFQSQLPSYDETLLRLEMSLFRDWLCTRYLDTGFSQNEEAAWRSLEDLLVENALQQPQVFVHRDYHSRNLMVTGERNPGILDFQDAVEGPMTYDLVSLLKDCYIRWPLADVRARAVAFNAAAADRGLPTVRPEQFLQSFELMGVQRHLKAAGIFARLKIRDGKPSYLQDVPRTLEHIVDIAGDYDELAFLGRFIRERCLPALHERLQQERQNRS